jgi:Serpin (serine protease inhibitor)
MMGFMEVDAVRAGDRGRRLGRLVDAYSRRVYPAVLEQQTSASVSSPLGVWLLLAACGSGARGEHRTALEQALGCTVAEASELLNEFVASPPPALKAAIAVWVSAASARPELAEWARGLPPAVESGFMPTKQEADAWADRNTLGLIKTFPAQIDASTKIVLASALATRVSWRTEFDVVPAAEHLGDTSPWHGTVKRMLWDSHPAPLAMITETGAAGLVAVHQAVAREDLTVISVSADPGTPRDRCLDAAHEMAACARNGQPVPARSLFDLPLGGGHSWQIDEREIQTRQSGERVERVAGASLAAWHVQARLDLKLSERFGSAPALATMGELIHDPDDETRAAQTAVASFTRYGFEAAAVTTFMRAAAAIRAPDRRGVQRTAILRFDHPYAALAIAGRPVPSKLPGRTTERRSPFAGLPVFAAWVHTPEEIDERPPRDV